MDHTLFTSQLKLTLITKAERGSQEFEWLHELRSDEKATFWSIGGNSKSFEDTERFISNALPVTVSDGEIKPYRIAYAVHELLSSAENNAVDTDDIPTRFIGLIGVKSLGDQALHLRSDILPVSTLEPECLTVELGYSYLPRAWGQGYATGAVTAVIEACKRAKDFWAPYNKVFVRAIVGPENPASRRVMAKSSMKELGTHTWDGEGQSVFVGGKWRTADQLHVYGAFIIE